MTPASLLTAFDATANQPPRASPDIRPSLSRMPAISEATVNQRLNLKFNLSLCFSGDRSNFRPPPLPLSSDPALPAEIRAIVPY